MINYMLLIECMTEMKDQLLMFIIMTDLNILIHVGHIMIECHHSCH